MSILEFQLAYIPFITVGCKKVSCRIKIWTKVNPRKWLSGIVGGCRVWMPPHKWQCRVLERKPFMRIKRDVKG
jgi:hypothetical protein